jgi:hypothetical protein
MTYRGNKNWMFWFRPAVILLWAAAATFAADDPLQATFQRMDAVAATFKGLRANLRRVSHLEVIHDDTVESGTVIVQRTHPKDLKMLLEIQSPPNPLKAFIGGGKVQVYYPNSKVVQEYEFGKASSLSEQLMALAFGSRSKDLLAYYQVRMVGPDQVAGQNATEIELTPKDKDLAAHFPKIDLWIADASGVTVQQKLHQPGGDYMLNTFTEIRLTSVPDSAVKLIVPKDARWEKPQK